MKIRDMTASEIDALLYRERIARLGCQRDGQPYVVPMNYVFADGAIWLHSLEGTKVEILRANPRVCIQVDRVEGPVTWQSVMALGRIEELRGDAAEAALRLIVERLMPPGTPAHPDPFAPPGMESRAVLLRIPIASRSGRFAQP